MIYEKKVLEDYLTHLDILQHHGVSELKEEELQYLSQPIINTVDQSSSDFITYGCNDPSILFVVDEIADTEKILSDSNFDVYRKILDAIGANDQCAKLLAFLSPQETSLHEIFNHYHLNTKFIVFMCKHTFEIVKAQVEDTKNRWQQYDDGNIMFDFACIPSFSLMNENLASKKEAWVTLQMIRNKI